MLNYDTSTPIILNSRKMNPISLNRLPLILISANCFVSKYETLEESKVGEDTIPFWMDFCPISTLWVSPESGEPGTVWGNDYLNEYWDRISSLHSVRFFLRLEFVKIDILIENWPCRHAENSLKLFVICSTSGIRRRRNGLRSLWGQNMPERWRKYMFNRTNIGWSGMRS